jgi:hypothetical protein
MDQDAIKQELTRCWLSPVYFTEKYVRIYNATIRDWIPFEMWPAQREALSQIMTSQYVIVLKARQLGMSWLCLSFALWLMLFRPIANIMIMSKRDEESVDLLTNRLSKMHSLLPEWMQAAKVERDSAHDLVLSNGSRAKAFPTSGGRSYTGTFVLLDEADFVPSLSEVLNAIKPAVDAGGQLVLISTVDKAVPLSTFKQLFRSAYYEKSSNYTPIFFSWRARPDRTDAWYRQVAADMFQQNHSNDDLYQEYPDTPEQALAPRQLDKRIPFDWLQACRAEATALGDADLPGVPGLTVYVRPQAGRRYVIGADPAEGNPTSDDSAATVVDAETWEEVAAFAGRWEPRVFGGYIDQVGVFFNSAAVLVERNNHGHALIMALETTGELTLLRGHSDEKPGWLSNTKGNTLLYDLAADVFREGATRIRSAVTIDQLASIEAATLAAPKGMHEDRADSFCLALAGCKWKYVSGIPSTVIPSVDPLVQYDDRARGW